MAHKTTALLLGIGIGVAVSLPAGVTADDTEIFLTQFSGTGISSGRPKVLVIFDNSGSMRNDVPQNKPAYDPDVAWNNPTEYPGAPANFQCAGASDPNCDRIFWSFDGNPPITGTDRYVEGTVNRCQMSVDPLHQTGRYTDYLRVWREGQGLIRTETYEECECQYQKNYWESWRWAKSMFDEPGMSQAECESYQGYNNNNYRLQCETYEEDVYGQIDIWRSVEDNNDTRQTSHLECSADIDSDIDTNPGHADGWASDSSGPFRSGSPGDPWDSWDDRHDGDLTRTLFTANYLAWYYNDDLIEQRKKIEIARDVVSELIANNPQVDFGVMLFNSNNGNGSGDENGGRVVKHLKHMEQADRTALAEMIDSVQPETWTPLCETYYEAYRYIARPNDTPQSLHFGDDDPYRTPYRDACAESDPESGSCSLDGTYNSPLGDCENIYVVIMTDGKPTYDTAANSRIRSLLGISQCGDYLTDHGANDYDENCMPKLARHMFENDMDDQWENGNQRVITYTIGFLTDQELLSDTAEFGGGTYFTAYNAHELADAFQATLTDILSSNTSFAAPAVAVDAYNRTKSLNAEYIAMFRPTARPRWPGNLKKLEMELIEGTDYEEVVDALGNRAVDPVTGNIKDTATTFWTTEGVDGMEVDQGGAGERLILRNPTTRNIYTNTGDGGALEDFDTNNGGLTASMFGTSDAGKRANFINWSRGIDVRDEDSDDDTADARPWILGDIMHSTPEAINFGNASQGGAPDVRIVFGTNAGFLHMIDGDTGEESWAFFPKELAAIVPILYDNDSDDVHPYGIDGSPSVWLNDLNGDGNISVAGGDQALLFFGLRRGTASDEGDGAGYYALDISNPDSPSFLWQLTQSDLPELGQTWSKPTPSFVPGHNNPVVVVGAGYDINKDSLGVGTADSVGRGVFVLDALDGSVVWSVTPRTDSEHLIEPGLKHSVPAEVTLVDSNGDHVTDRMYFPDTGGNIWRVDLVDDDPANWSVFKLASLGGSTAQTDRRFMSRIDFAVTKSGDLSYDALMVGSGNRAHPLDRVAEDRFFMIRDTATQSVLHVPDDGNADSSACESSGVNPDQLPCREIPAPLTADSLYDATGNLIQDGNEDQRATARSELSASDGWFIDLERLGEKSLSRSITLQGRVFFSTYVPPDPFKDGIEQVCRPSEGTGFLYAVGLHDAVARYDWAAPYDEQLEKSDRSKAVKDHIPDYPVPYFGSVEIGLVGIGPGTDGTGIERTGLGLGLSAVYWLMESQ